MLYGIDENGKAIPSRTNPKGDIFISPLAHNVYDLTGIVRLLKFGEAENTTNVIYTVPASKIGYITSLFCHISNASGAGNVSDIRILDAGSVEIMRWRIAAVAGALNVMSIAFSIPIKLTAGEKVALYSPAGLVYIRGSFTGYELPV